MSKFQIGDGVKVVNPDSPFDEKRGKIIGFIDLGLSYLKVTVEFSGDDMVFFREEELELVRPVVEYEYAVQKSFGPLARNIKPEEWVDEATARAYFNAYPKSNNYDPTWGGFTVKLVKRQKAGRIEDV